MIYLFIDKRKIHFSLFLDPGFGLEGEIRAVVKANDGTFTYKLGIIGAYYFKIAPKSIVIIFFSTLI